MDHKIHTTRCKLDESIKYNYSFTYRDNIHLLSKQLVNSMVKLCINDSKTTDIFARFST